MDDNIIQNIVRVGIVTDVDRDKRLVRVRFPNINMTSGWLYILKSPPEVHMVFEATVEPWLPSVNDKVLCIYLPVFNGDGFVLGAI